MPGSRNSSSRPARGGVVEAQHGHQTTVRTVADEAAPDELPEQVEGTSDDAGGVPYDDDLGEDAERPVTRGGPAYDSAKSLTERSIALPVEAPLGMQELRRYVRTRWGGADLGILAKPPRAVRAGDTPSLHNWGIAWDWRWQDPGPGRQAADAVIEFCLGNAEVLGIQAVHDYQGTRFWKSFSGWQTGKPESQDRHGPAMGAVVAHRANLAVGQPGDVDRGTAREIRVPARPPTPRRRRHRRHHRRRRPTANTLAHRAAAARQQRRRRRATAGFPAPVRLRRLHS